MLFVCCVSSNFFSDRRAHTQMYTQRETYTRFWYAVQPTQNGFFGDAVQQSRNFVNRP
eukprot:TRINITY_DN58_c0_g1_i5.p2 TRINITY_DN58_c0_g1~~TRINITY_DN58_c0_g1_i5.p2  ORF type:complete len:58 (-),score=4.97 TRINITY_DN58_c0_g1_i5:461-634(-)